MYATPPQTDFNQNSPNSCIYCEQLRISPIKKETNTSYQEYPDDGVDLPLMNPTHMGLQPFQKVPRTSRNLQSSISMLGVGVNYVKGCCRCQQCRCFDLEGGTLDYRSINHRPYFKPDSYQSYLGSNNKMVKSLPKLRKSPPKEETETAAADGETTRTRVQTIKRLVKKKKS